MDLEKGTASFILSEAAQLEAVKKSIRILDENLNATNRNLFKQHDAMGTKTASMEEMASAAQELSDTADRLKNIVNSFKLDPAPRGPRAVSAPSLRASPGAGGDRVQR